MIMNGFDATLLPDNDELDEISLPDESLEGETVTFEHVRHEFDQLFESDAIPDAEAPELVAITHENSIHHFTRC